MTPDDQTHNAADRRDDVSLTCPLPIRDHAHVLLAHGGGGRLMHELIERVFLVAFDDPALTQAHDSAVLDFAGGQLAMTTDSYVVKPLFFPGGDIGSMAVHGTVNDLAMAGARPMYLSAGFVLEEGLEMQTLWQIVCSMSAAAERAGVRIVTGDTKVVERGHGDGVYINTTGVGLVEHGRSVGPGQILPRDTIVVSGDLGRHGVAVMSEREGICFETPVDSDSAALGAMVQALFDAHIHVRCLRDLTRGGLATCLNEIAATAHRRLQIEEACVPVDEGVRGACEMLGLDPLYVACEGRLIAVVDADDADRCVEIMQRFSDGAHAARIGMVTDFEDGLVVATNAFGTRRVLDMLSGEQLPRIC